MRWHTATFTELVTRDSAALVLRVRANDLGARLAFSFLREPFAKTLNRFTPIEYVGRTLDTLRDIRSPFHVRSYTLRKV